MSRYQGPIVDVDVHHRWSQDHEVLPYLPERWREYAAGELGGGRSRALAPQAVSGSDAAGKAGIVRFSAPGSVVAGNLDHGARRRDAYPANGSRPGSDYPTLKEQLLHRYNYFRAILTFDIGSHA